MGEYVKPFSLIYIKIISMKSITMKEVMIGIVVVWFQISLASINTRLTGIDANVVKQMVDVGKLQTAMEDQGEDYIFLRKQLGEVDTKLSKHIELDKPRGN